MFTNLQQLDSRSRIIIVLLPVALLDPEEPQPVRTAATATRSASAMRGRCALLIVKARGYAFREQKPRKASAKVGLTEHASGHETVAASGNRATMSSKPSSVEPRQPTC